MYRYRVKEVLRVIDGDTIDLRLDLGFNILHNVRVRLSGINTPESRTKDLKEKRLGLKAKKVVQAYCDAAEELLLDTEKAGKFGRYLGMITNQEGEWLHELLLDSGLAREYHGGKRGKWFEDEKLGKGQNDK